MLNWIAYWGGSYLFGLGRAAPELHAEVRPDLERRRRDARSYRSSGATRAAGPAHRPLHRTRRARRLLGDPEQDDAGLPGARGRLQPGGGPLRRASACRGTTSSRWRSPACSPGSRARSTSSAGSSGSRSSDVQASQVGFIGIAVALLGRNTAVGTFFAALLFGALYTGTSTRHLDPTVFRPDLAGNLAQIIQGLVVLFVGADVLVLYVWNAAPEAQAAERRGTAPGQPARGGGEHDRLGSARQARRSRRDRPAAHDRDRRRRAGRRSRSSWRCRRSRPAHALVADRDRLPRPLLRRLGARRGARSGSGGASRSARPSRSRPGRSRPSRASGNLETVFAWSALTAATLRFATPLIFAAIGGMFSERSGVVNIGLEGMMLTGAFFGIWGADITGSWVGRARDRDARRRAAGARSTRSSQSSLRADQIVGGTAINFLAAGITGFLFIDIYGTNGTPSGIPEIPDVHLTFLATPADRRLPRGRVRADEPDDLARARARPGLVACSCSGRPPGCGCARLASTRARRTPSGSRSTGRATSRSRSRACWRRSAERTSRSASSTRSTRT